MAILTRGGMEKILRRIWETGGMTEDMERDIERLRDDYDEREGILKKYGEVYDGEDQDEYEYVEKIGSIDTSTMYTPIEEAKELTDLREQYEEMRRRYIDRFFGGKGEGEYLEIMRGQKEDVRRDGEPQTFDELLEKVEG